MCGFAALLTSDLSKRAEAESVNRMLDAIAHRGPDGQATWLDSNGAALGHCRLSILDVSQNGRQPMTSSSGRFVIVYNGEIYNYLEIAEELRDTAECLRLRGGSDTEVLLEAIERWGLAAAVKKAVGMFAFVLWDTWERRMSLVRDRLGKKPLYYGVVDGQLRVASELGAISCLGGVLTLDHDAMALFARFSFIPDPWSAYQEVRKLPAGTILSLGQDELQRTLSIEPQAYFTIDNLIVCGREARESALPENEAVEMLDDVLRTAVTQRLRSDVPLGAFLSGGIDSSLVVALAQRQLKNELRTFSIGFENSQFDESVHAAKIARHLGTRHTDFVVSPREVLGLADEMVRVYDEPFADSSQLPTTLVSRLAREHVKVVLTGDGGDEVFAGYNRYIWGRRVWSYMRQTPEWLRQRSAGLATGLSPRFWNNVSEALARLVPAKVSVPNAGEKVEKLARILQCRSPEELHLSLASHWFPQDGVVIGRSPPLTRVQQTPSFLRELDAIEQALWFDTVQGLPGDMLVKVDRATMSVGLEARQPLLDHRVVELSWKMPLRLKVRGGVGKWILREILAKYVPRELWERPKMGFSVPIDDWLRGPLRSWAEDLLSHASLRIGGVFEPSVVRPIWEEHCAGRANHGSRIWIIVSAQAWLFAKR